MHPMLQMSIFVSYSSSNMISGALYQRVMMVWLNFLPIIFYFFGEFKV